MQRRSQVDRVVDPQAEILVRGADISARDNLALSMAGANAASIFEKLLDMGMVEPAEMLRVVYRFLGESANSDALLSRGSGVDRRGEKSPAVQALPGKPKIKVDPGTGEIKPAQGMD